MLCIMGRTPTEEPPPPELTRWIYSASGLEVSFVSDSPVQSLRLFHLLERMFPDVRFVGCEVIRSCGTLSGCRVARKGL